MRCEMAEFNTDLSQLRAINEALNNKKPQKIDMYLRVVAGVADLAGYPTNVSKLKFKNNQYVKKVFSNGESLKKFYKREIAWILSQVSHDFSAAQLSSLSKMIRGNWELI